jgi:hypothetical protein
MATDVEQALVHAATDELRVPGVLVGTRLSRRRT